LPPHATARLGTLRLTQAGHSVSFSPDGISIATSGHGNGRWHADMDPETDPRHQNIRIWDVATGKERRRLAGSGDYLAFSPDSRALAIGDHSGVSMRDVRSGKRLWHWALASDKHSPRYGGVAFAPDGKSVAVPVGLGFAEDKGTVRILSAATGKEVRSFLTRARFVAYAPAGKTLASFDSYGKKKGASLWDPAAGKLLHDLAFAEAVTQVVFSHDSRTVAVAGNTVALFDVRSGKEVRKVDAGGIGYPLRFTADGKRLRTGEWSLDLATGEQKRHFEESNGYGVALSSDSRVWATSDHGALRLWDTASERELVPLGRHRGPIGHILPSADGRTIRTVCRWDETIREWDALTGKPLGVARLPPWPRFSAASADGKRLATPCPWSEYAIYDVSSGDLAEGGEANVNAGALALSVDGRRVAAVSAGKVRLWDAVAGKKLHEMKAEPAALAFSADGKTLAGASDLDRLELWDTATGKPRRGHRWRPAARKHPADSSLAAAGSDGAFMLFADKATPSPAAGLVFSPTGALLAVSSGFHRVRRQGFDSPDAGLVRVYDVATGKELFQLSGVEPVVAFSPDGKTLAAGAHGDHAVELREAATGRLLRRFIGHEGEVTSLAFTADGRRLISGSADGTGLVWDVAGG